MEQRAMSYHSQGLARALRLLKQLGVSESPVSLAHLSLKLDVPKSTLVRLIAVLEDEGFVRRQGDPPTFAIGDSMLEIANNVLRKESIVELATPILRKLAEETGFTANIGVLSGASVLHVCVEEPDRPLRFRSSIGSLDHTYCTGLGKMLLAEVPSALLHQFLPAEPYLPFTEDTITTRHELEKELSRIREQGFSFDKQERDLGVACIAVPIRNSIGAHVALSVAGPSGELDEAKQVEARELLGLAAIEFGSNLRFLSSLHSVRGAFLNGVTTA